MYNVINLLFWGAIIGGLAVFLTPLVTPLVAIPVATLLVVLAMSAGRHV